MAIKPVKKPAVKRVVGSTVKKDAAQKSQLKKATVKTSAKKTAAAAVAAKKKAINAKASTKKSTKTAKVVKRKYVRKPIVVAAPKRKYTRRPKREDAPYEMSAAELAFHIAAGTIVIDEPEFEANPVKIGPQSPCNARTEFLHANPAAQTLHGAFTTLQEKATEYGRTDIQIRNVMGALFPNGVALNSPERMKVHAMFTHLVTKIVRFAACDMQHVDSAQDAINYAAWVRTALAEQLEAEKPESIA
jgi:hypothetical protein